MSDPIKENCICEECGETENLMFGVCIECGGDVVDNEEDSDE